MSITFACPCGKLLKARVEYAGKRTRCTRCGASLVIPQASDDLDATPEPHTGRLSSDFEDVELVVKAAVAQAADRDLTVSSPPLRPDTSGSPVLPPPPPSISNHPDPDEPIEPALELDADANTDPALSPRPVLPPGEVPWYFPFLQYDAYLCMALGIVQFLMVIATSSATTGAERARALVTALVVLAVALGFGGLILVVLDIARGLRDKTGGQPGSLESAAQS